jgi:hypothetical protein
VQTDVALVQAAVIRPQQPFGSEMRRIATALFLSAVTFALAAPAYASTGHTITVKAKDFSFALSAKTVPHGRAPS